MRFPRLPAAIASAALLLTFAPLAHAQYLVSASSLNLAATALFSNVGGYLEVVLTNTSTHDVLVPVDVLTAVCFNVEGVAPLSTVGSSAVLSPGSSVFFDPDGQPVGGNVGGEWGYGTGLAAPRGATEGISSSGFGLFGGPTFNGPNLSDPIALDGLNYGITSAGDNTATGNAKVTGGVPLIKNSVTFRLNGLGAVDPNSLNITNVSFQYGTALNEPNIIPQVPEPGTLTLLGTVMIGAFGIGLRRRRR